MPTVSVRPLPPIPPLKRPTILTRHESVTLLVGAALLCTRCCFGANVDVHVPAEWRCAFLREFDDLLFEDLVF